MSPTSAETTALKAALRVGFIAELRRVGYQGSYPCLRRHDVDTDRFVTFQVVPGFGRVRVALYEAKPGELANFTFASVASMRDVATTLKNAAFYPMPDWIPYSPAAPGREVPADSCPQKADRLIQDAFSDQGGAWR